jgi:hypothetical protein
MDRELNHNEHVAPERKACPVNAPGDSLTPQNIFAEATESILKEYQNVSLSLDWQPVEFPWDINNGLCEEWALYVCNHLPGAESVWVDELPHRCRKNSEGYCVCVENERIPSHCVVRYQGKLYDSECHTGVKSWRDLPIEIHKGQTREDMLARLGLY